MLLHNKVMAVVGILSDDTDPMVSVMKATPRGVAFALLSCERASFSLSERALFSKGDFPLFPSERANILSEMRPQGAAEDERERERERPPTDPLRQRVRRRGACVSPLNTSKTLFVSRNAGG